MVKHDFTWLYYTVTAIPTFLIVTWIPLAITWGPTPIQTFPVLIPPSLIPQFFQGKKGLPPLQFPPIVPLPICVLLATLHSALWGDKQPQDHTILMLCVMMRFMGFLVCRSSGVTRSPWTTAHCYPSLTQLCDVCEAAAIPGSPSSAVQSCSCPSKAPAVCHNAAAVPGSPSNRAPSFPGNSAIPTESQLQLP